MSDQELAALQVAADEKTIAVEPEASEETENTEGQVEVQPANADAEAEAAEKTKSQLRRERREAAETRRRDEAEAAQRKLAETQAELARIRDLTVAEPKESDFQDPFEYASAKGAWHVHNQGIKGQESRLAGQMDAIQAQQKGAEQAHLAALATAFKDAIPDVVARLPDFNQALGVATDPAIVSQGLSVMILESEAAHDIAYHLGKNPDVARKLSAMNPVHAARELGKLEARLSEPKPVTKAPDPYRPARGAATPAPKIESMTVNEFDAWRRSGGTFTI